MKYLGDFESFISAMFIPERGSLTPTMLIPLLLFALLLPIHIHKSPGFFKFILFALVAVWLLLHM